jgi:drug/metabolite transporter (DMT)-like permease
MAYLSVVVAQLLYTMSDTWKKAILNASGFSAATLVKPAFLLTLLVAGIGFLFQMHALSKIDLSRTIVFMGMLAVIFSSAAGIIFFKEQLNHWNVLGLGFAVAAIILVNIK